MYPKTDLKPKHRPWRQLHWFEVMDDLPLSSKLWNSDQLNSLVFDLVFLSVKVDQLSPTWQDISNQSFTNIKLQKYLTAAKFHFQH